MIARFWRWLVSLFRGKPEPLYMGVYLFPGWASPRPEYGLVPGVQCPLKWPWADPSEEGQANRTPSKVLANRTPAIGEYDEALPEVTVWREAQMIRGKIDFCVYQHEWSPDLGLLTMNHCAENHPADSPVAFCLSWWDVLTNSSDGETYFSDPKWTLATVTASLKAYSKAVAPFTRKASYLKIDGRPVLFRGAAHSLRFYARWGLTPNMVLDLMASAITPRPYFVSTACDPIDHAVLKMWGFDAFTEYNLFADSWPSVMETYRYSWERALGIAKETGIEYWVPTTCGFDSREWGTRLPFVFIPTSEQLTEHLREARQFAQDNYRYTHGRVLLNNWSEYGEGSILEPMLHNGDELLMAHARAVA